MPKLDAVTLDLSLKKGVQEWVIMHQTLKTLKEQLSDAEGAEPVLRLVEQTLDAVSENPPTMQAD